MRTLSTQTALSSNGLLRTLPGHTKIWSNICSFKRHDNRRVQQRGFWWTPPARRARIKEMALIRCSLALEIVAIIPAMFSSFRLGNGENDSVNQAKLNL